MSKKITLVHFRNKCIGCGSCADLAPDHWVISTSDGKATLKYSQKKNQCFVKEIHEIDFYQNEQASQACPVNIIQVNQS